MLNYTLATKPSAFLLRSEPNEQSLYLRVSDIDLLWRDIENKLSDVKTKAL